MKLCVMVAVSNNGAIGKDGCIPWHIPEDLVKFRITTLTNAIVSGRRTFEEMGVLDQRLQFVVTNNPTEDDQVRFVSSLTAAMAQAEQAGYERLFVVGGEQLYREATLIADELYITRVNTVIKQADAFFPLDLVDNNPFKWKLVSQSPTKGNYPMTYNFEHYTRREA